jgi:hypothetical protein
MLDQGVTGNLELSLRHFTGTERYHRFHSRTVFTDGALYLADASWLLLVDGCVRVTLARDIN